MTPKKIITDTETRELVAKEFYKKNILTEEEDVDNFGNKGWFQHSDDFQVIVLFEGSGDDYKKVMAHHNLDPNLFELMIITP